jgi:lipase chaperone LimK
MQGKYWLMAGAALVAAFWLARRPEPAPLPVAAKPPVQAPFVRSMEGTRPDGNVRQDAAQQLVVDAELGYLFDYYLAGLGERGLEAIRAEIERELDRRLVPLAARQAKALLGKYLDYKQALATLDSTIKPGKDLLASARARRGAMLELRKRYFTEQESAGLFGQADAYDADALARLEVNQDKQLPPAQREARLAQLDAALSPEQRAQREAPVAIMKVESAVARMRAQGAGDNEVYRARAAAFTPEAAARLAELDREQAQWQARIATYLQQRRQLPPGDAQAAQQLRDAGFTALEQKRLAAYE